MAPDLGNFWWVPIVAAAIGGFLVPIIGYYRRPRNGHQHSHSTFHGTAMFDASVAKDVLAQMVELVIQTRRIADVAESMLAIEQDRERLEQRRREAEHENAIRDRDALQRKLDAQERGKR